MFDLENYSELYDSDLFTEDEIKMINNIDIVFIEEIRTYLPKITKDSNYVEIESLRIEADRPEKMDLAEKFAELIKPNLVENDYSGTIYGLDEFEVLDKRIKEVSSELGLPLDVTVSTVSTLNVPQYNYSINGSGFAYYHDTPHLDKKGSWVIHTDKQSIRELARKINDLEQGVV